MVRNLLDPVKKEIVGFIERHEEVWGYSEKILYDRCIKDMKKVRLCEIEEKDVNGPTAATKVLHLLCPEFFPMWDTKIRRDVRIRGNEEGYYKYMEEIQSVSKNSC